MLLEGKAVDKENARSCLPVSSKAASSITLKPQTMHQLLGQASSRKALGNITNINATAKQDGAMSADKKNVALLKPRRALGDITNSAAGPSRGLPTPGGVVKPKAAAAPHAAEPRHALFQQQPETAAPRPTEATTKAELFARGGIERMAGKGWAQLEAERLREEDSAIKQRVRMLAAALPPWRTPIDAKVCALGCMPCAWGRPWMG